jgi:hypothetical protein
MDFGILSLLLWDDWFLLVELAHRVVFLAPAHLVILDGKHVEADPPRFAARASSVLRVPEAVHFSFDHQLLIIRMTNNPVVL